MRYEARFAADCGAQEIDLGAVDECVQAWLNGEYLGERIAPPYTYDVAGHILPGENRLVLEIANSLVHKHPDHFSRYVQIPPSGLLGPVRLLRD